jgi:hypothetical protein
VRDELPFSRQENERLGLLLDNRDDMLREAKKMRKELRLHSRMLGLEWLS